MRIEVDYSPQPHQRQLHDCNVSLVAVTGRQIGKALHIDTPILTTNGYKKIINVKEGDEIFSINGNKTRVIYKSEIYKDRECYEIEFSNGEVIIADASHDWILEDYKYRKSINRYPLSGRKPLKLTTEEIFNTFLVDRPDGKFQSNYSVKITPVYSSLLDLPIEPYYLGLWLGDGNSRNSGITTVESEVISYLEGYAKRLGLFITKTEQINRTPVYSISTKNNRKLESLTGRLRKLNLIQNKHIPQEYFVSSFDQRLDLMKGLIDSDGHVKDNGGIEFTTINKQLAIDFIRLSSTLGIKAKISVGKATLNGEIISPKYRVTFTAKFPVGNVERKKKYSSFHRKDLDRIYIRNVKKTNSVPVQCLMVDDQSHLFLAGNTLIPTHNTIAAVNELIKRAVIIKGSRNWYVTNDYRQAKRNVWDILIKYLPKELAKDVNKSDLVVNLINGSKIELIGVENAEKLRGAAVHFMVLDEYADFKDGVFEKVLEPMLTTTNGQMWFLGCVTKDTFIFTDNGMRQIGENKQGYVDVDESIYGLNGFNKAIQRFGNPEAETIKIVTAKGFEIEGTPNHKIMTHYGWKRLDSLSEGDFIIIQSNNNVFGTLKEELAYLIGLYLAEGCIEFYKTKNGDKPSRITITNNESGDFLNKYGFKTKDGIHWRLNSKKLAEHILEYVPRNKAPKKYLSDKALSLDKESMRLLLQGYFDGDGFADSKKSRVGSTSSSKKLSKQIQMLLLNFGILSSFSSVTTPITKKSKVESVGYRVIAEGHGAYLFHKRIGFKIPRKARNSVICNKSIKNSYQVYFDKNDFKKYSGNIRSGIKNTQKTISVYRLNKILKENKNNKYNVNNLADKIKVVSKSRNKTSDFVIPETHSYFSNGFISHNTPKGLGNDFYFKYVEDNKFRKFKFPSCTISGGKVIQVLSVYTSIKKMQEIYDRAVKEGKLDYFNQEHLAEFIRPSGTVYKEWSIDNYKDFEYDENLPLHLTFDFGVNDPTVVIWIQPKGSETRIIDYYEATNADINHFIQVIKAKPYKTPEFCAGDIAGRSTDLTSGKSPILVLQEAGYYIKTSHIPNIPAQIRQAHTKIPHLYINHKSSRFKDIILNYRYPEVKTDIRNQSNEIPLHDQWCHGARAFEYWCWNYSPPDQEMIGIKKHNTGQELLDIIEENRKARDYLSWI